MVVTCPDIDEASAQLRLRRPAADVTHKGTVVLTTGGFGLNWYDQPRNPPVVGEMLDTFVSDGFLTVEVKWEEPGIWGGARARTLACRYATVARWTHDDLHEGGEETLFVAQGNSGDADQIAFGLAHYGLDEIIDLASLGGGPHDCPRCSRTPGYSREPLLGGNPRVDYPSTTVRIFLGENEPSQGTIDSANEYFNAITSEKTVTIVPNTAHDIRFTPEGTAALIAAVREAVTAQ